MNKSKDLREATVAYKKAGNSRKGGSVYRTQESSGGFFSQIKVKKGR